MPKAFCVAADYDVRVGFIWHGPGLVAHVEPGVKVEVYYAPRGKRGACVGTHTYETLDEAKPPRGLKTTKS